MKKLKMWPRKRRRKKIQESYYSLPPPYPPPPPPQPPCHYYYPCSASTEPSAPPLPSWLEAEQNYGTFVEASTHSIPEVAYTSQAQHSTQEITTDNSSLISNLPASIGNSSYQQYMVREPVYGVPLIQTARTERSNWIFGCLFNFGVHVFRCLFPCFHIREVV